MSFEKRVKDNLSYYKEHILKNSKPGHIKHRYILPKEDGNLNYLLGIRDKIDGYLNQLEVPINLHRGFHHLNSSQAMCLNFFYPFIQENSYTHLTQALKLNGEITSLIFEHVENEKEGTNFDVCLNLKNKQKVFIEIKYTEAKFKSISNISKGHLFKKQTFYMEPLLKGFNEDWLEHNFFKNYQLLRNLPYANQNQLVYLIFSRQHTKMVNEVNNVLNIMNKEMRKYVEIVYWEDLVSNLLNAFTQDDIASKYLHVHFKDFQEKYSL
ncbi:hypothetical protein WAX74_15215 [Psychrobacillus sp. FJAT-51614]|uniref:Uncharacterized protein n=1 Tax=Psychrobacillus mangrovi TaxID=3117745 RepID=A0ABU8F7I1_9BACI